MLSPVITVSLVHFILNIHMGFICAHVHVNLTGG